LACMSVAMRRAGQAFFLWATIEAGFALVAPLFTVLYEPQPGFSMQAWEYLHGPEPFIITAALCVARGPSLMEGITLALAARGRFVVLLVLGLLLTSTAAFTLSASAAVGDLDDEPTWLLLLLILLCLAPAAASVAVTATLRDRGVGGAPRADASHPVGLPECRRLHLTAVLYGLALVIASWRRGRRRQ